MLPILIIFLIVSPALYLIFSNSQINPFYFFVGCGTCLFIQSILLTSYCIFKLQQTFRRSHTITLKTNPQLHFGEQYKFKILPQVSELFCNKFIEVPKILDKHNAIVMDNLYYNYEETEIDEEPRKKIMDFLNLIRGYNGILNRFNNCLVNFGKNFTSIENTGLIRMKNYSFTEYQSNLPSEISQEQLQNPQRKILHQIKQQYKARKQGQNSKKLIFPTWKNVIQTIKFIGQQFQKIQMIQQANSTMLGMIHSKVLQDYQKIQDKIRSLGKGMEQLVQKTYSLKKDYDKYKIEQINQILKEKEPHNEMKYWLRKKIFQFKDLQRKITENQKKFKIQREELSSYKISLASFTDQNKQKYQKIIRTRFIAFLDSYFITVSESVNQLQTIIYNQYPNPTPIKPPKVSKWRNYKNMNQALQFEKVYQKEYFDRAQFFNNKLKSIINSLVSLGSFLNQLKQIFGNMKDVLDNLDRQADKNAEKQKKTYSKQYLIKSKEYFRRFLKHLNQKNNDIFVQIKKLTEINQKVRQFNQPQLVKISDNISAKMSEAKAILQGIHIEQGPVFYKYSSSKSKLEQIYKQIEENIKKIKQSEQQYLTHSSRVKKILVFSLIKFLGDQKKILGFWIDKKIPPQYEEENNEEEYLQNQAPKSLLEDEMNEIFISIFQQKNQGLHTGFSLSKNYLQLLNRFLFVAFTQWKNSQFFKKQLTQELTILFNSEPAQNFSTIYLSKMQFSGAPPQIVWVRQLKCQSSQAFLDLYLAFKGKWQFKINTQIVIFGRFSVQVKIQVEQFYCVMRLCFVPSTMGWGWFSFIGEPISKFKVIPSIGTYTLQMQPIKNMFHNLIMGKLKKLTYPTRQKLLVPISKKDEEAEIIKKKLFAAKPKQNQNLVV